MQRQLAGATNNTSLRAKDSCSPQVQWARNLRSSAPFSLPLEGKQCHPITAKIAKFLCVQSTLAYFPFMQSPAVAN